MWSRDSLSATLILSGRFVPVVLLLPWVDMLAVRRACSSFVKHGTKLSLSNEVVGNWRNGMVGDDVSMMVATPVDHCQLSIGSFLVGLGWLKLSFARALVGDWRVVAVTPSGRGGRREKRFNLGRACIALGSRATGVGGWRSSSMHCFLSRLASQSLRSRCDLSRCSCSISWPRKLKLGDIVGRLSFTYLQHTEHFLTPHLWPVA